MPETSPPAPDDAIRPTVGTPLRRGDADAAGSVGGRSRFDGVQAMRFLAALLVVITHSTLYTHERLDSSLPVWHFGEVGVDIFFTISGFVMYASSAKHLATPGYWKSFATRRIIRIVPMYWIATTIKLLTLFLLPAAVLHAEFSLPKTLLSYFFLPSRNVDGAVEPLLGVGWTLTFEMFFYALFAVTLLLRRNVIVVAAVVMTLCSLGYLFRPAGYPAALVYLNPIVMYFVAGMIIGRWAFDRNWRRALWSLGYVVVVWAVVAVLVDPAHMDYLGFIRHVSVVVFVGAVVALEPLIGRRIPAWVVYLGDASYTLYLFHPLIAPLVPTVLDKVGIESVVVSMILAPVTAIVAAAVIYRIVERPLTRVLQRHAPFIKPHAPASIEAASAP